MWGLRHPYQIFISEAEGDSIPWNDIKCVLWFPYFASYEENLEGQKRLMQNFFEYLAIRILASTLYEVQVIVTMNNIRFSQLQVEKLGRDCFFFFAESFPFDESRFGEVPDSMTTKKPMVPSRASSYVFNMHPPSDFQFGDYTTALSNHLCSSK
ncbi:hypothetical protein Ancab_019526 [Ancistrocladus abbreviatus]